MEDFKFMATIYFVGEGVTNCARGIIIDILR